MPMKPIDKKMKIEKRTCGKNGKENGGTNGTEMECKYM